VNAVSPFKPPSFPPATAEYTSSFQPPKPGAPPSQSAYRFTRASDGKTRVDSGTTSVISNPASGHAILLNHANKTALVTPVPPPGPTAPQAPQVGAPAMPGAPPQPPGMQGQDLGKSVLQGHEVEGKRFVIQPPAQPPMPGAPKAPPMPGAQPAPPAAQMPGAPAPPKAPGVPGAPATPPAPAVPQAPKAPTIVETWTSTNMHLPMLTKMQGPSGQMTQVCHSAVPGEPHPSAFQIPPGYKMVGPAGLPKLPASPKLPTPPKL